MVTTIKKGASKKEIQNLFKEAEKRKLQEKDLMPTNFVAL